jgi:DNA-binding NarL/FixJ family response regulator
VPDQEWFLVVDDEPAVAGAIARVLERHGRVVMAGSCDEACRHLDDQLVGLVVDMGLPDGEGLRVLRAALARRPALSALILTGSADPRYCHEAYALGVSYLRKPSRYREIDAFGERAKASAGASADRVQAAIARLGTRLSLSPREIAILTAAVDGADHARLAALGNVTVGTVKNQVSLLLQKAGVGSLQELVRKVLRSALS